MENSFGSFLKQKRQEKNLTQKQLATLLFVTESSVSKWEKNVAHPDITLLPKLSQILGVTEHELITASVDNKSRQEKKEAKKWRTLSMSWNLFFYISYGIALISCFVCDLAINKTLSWFWIVFSALILSFSFTNLPKLIKKHKSILIPISIFLSLCLLLATCSIYTKGDWFWIASLSITLGFSIIFSPVYIAKYKVFSKFKKYNDFVSITIDFIILNILLIVVDFYSISNHFSNSHWYLSLALPIVIVVYLILNLFLSIRFLKTNKLFKTTIILLLINFFVYILPLFIKTNNPFINKELNDLNIFNANLSIWIADISLEQNIHLIIFLTILMLSLIFFVCGLFLHFKQKNKEKI